MRRWLLGLLGYHDWPGDLEDEVPDDIGITGPVLSHGEFGNRFWYLTATYGIGDDHQHVEIKLDAQGFADLWGSVTTEMEKLRQK